MEWLNYHHLHYFWMVAKEGSLRKAAEKLHVSQPSISAQLRALETVLGEPLFRRSGRTKVLTDAGQIAFSYAEEIFSLGRELLNTLAQHPTAKALRFSVGVTDSVPKLVAHEILRPVFAMPHSVHVICREGKVEDLLAQLAAHRLDIVLSDEPASSSVKVKVFNHPLGESGVTFCARPPLAARLRKGFPRSLHDAPAFVPTENTALRRSLENWFRANRIRPRVLGEFEDVALMKAMAAEEDVFMAVPSVVAREVVTRYKLAVIGATDNCKAQFFAIAAERRIAHPAVQLITSKAQNLLSS